MNQDKQAEALRIANSLKKRYDLFPLSDEFAAVAELNRQHARIAELEAELVTESARTANYKLRAEQFEQRLDMANKMGNEARAELAAAKATKQGLDAQKEARNTGINHGICLALQLMTSHGDAGGTQWEELVDLAGREEMEHYAKYVEPEEWELAGFAHVERFKAEIDAIGADAAQAKQGGAA